MKSRPSFEGKPPHSQRIHGLSRYVGMPAPQNVAIVATASGLRAGSGSLEMTRPFAYSQGPSIRKDMVRLPHQVSGETSCHRHDGHLRIDAERGRDRAAVGDVEPGGAVHLEVLVDHAVL